MLGGYAAGAWLPRVAAVSSVLVCAATLVVVNQLAGQPYHWLDDAVFFLVVVGGAAGGGAAVTLRARQVERLERLAAELDEQQRVDVAAARLEEQTRVQQQVHARLAERIAAIACGRRARSARTTTRRSRRWSPRPAACSTSCARRSARWHRPATRNGRARTCTGTAAATRRRSTSASRASSASRIAVETVVHPLARGPVWANVLASLLVAAPLVVRRAHPIAAIVGVAAGGARHERLADAAPGHGHRVGLLRPRLLHGRRLVPVLVVGRRAG